MTPKIYPTRDALWRRPRQAMFPFRGHQLPVAQLLTAFSDAIPFCRDEQAWLALYGLCLFEYGSGLSSDQFQILLDAAGLAADDTKVITMNRSALLEYPALAKFIKNQLAPGSQFWRAPQIPGSH